MAALKQLIVNAISGEQRVVDLTEAELAQCQRDMMAAQQRAAVRDAIAVRRAARQAALDTLLDKLESNPTLLDRFN